MHRAISLLTIALVVGATSLGTYVAQAVFNAQATAGGNTATAGSGSIRLSTDNATWASALTGPVAATGLDKAGTEKFGGHIIVRNEASGAPFAYTAAAADATAAGAANDAVKSTLQVAIDSVVAGSACGATSGGGQTQVKPFTAYGTGSGLEITAARTLGDNAAERLCYYFKLASPPDNAAGGSVAFNLTFNAV